MGQSAGLRPSFRETLMPNRPLFVRILVALLAAWSPLSLPAPRPGCLRCRCRDTATDPAAAESKKLQELVDGYFEEYLALNPLLATSIGDPRYNDRFEVSISPDWRARNERLQRGYLERIKDIEPRPARPAGPHLVRGLPVGARDGDRGPALSRLPDPAEPVLLGAEHVRAAWLGHRAAAFQDRPGLRRLPQARRRARRVDRPGDRQHARGRREGLHAAARAGRARAAAARVAGRGAAGGLVVLGSRSGTCRRTSRPRIASASRRPTAR